MQAGGPPSAPAESTATRWLRPPVLVSRSERTRPLDRGALLPRISLELARTCNLRCRFCYADASPERTGGLSDDEVRAVIAEAAALGATMISIVGGGETLLRRSLLVDGQSCIDYANSLGCYSCVYTNGTLVDDAAARWLFERDVAVVGKLLSLRDDVQDDLLGVPGATTKLRRGIDALLRAGLASAPRPRLALECVITKRNYDELPELWRWMRRRAIVPEVEIPTPQGRAVAHGDALLFDDDEAPDKYRRLFEELLAIDRAEFGYDWIPHPPFVAGSCQLYYVNCYVNDQGGVQPCASVDREYGILRVGPRRDRGRPLAEIVASPEFRALRSIHQHLRGACRDCDLNYTCYGCRAAAWHKTGDLFAEDPVCWRHRAVRSERDGAHRPRLGSCRGEASPCTARREARS